MNFLQLCQDLYREGGISGQISSTQNQTGEAARVVGWVQKAYLEILNDQPDAWNFTRESAVKQLTAGVGTYSFEDLDITNGVQWDTDTMRFATSDDLSDEAHLSELDFASFRNTWQFGPARTQQGSPADVSVDNDTKLVIGPIPAAAVWLVFDYKAMPMLISDSDVPVLPSRFHNAIMWRALRHYGLYEAAPEVVARADIAYKEAMLQLTVDQTPEVQVEGPLC